MNLFGLEGSGFIISLGITLLLSGLIMYYCVQRINSLEQSLVKQGEIIQTFIYKLNNLELQNNSISHQTNLETNFNTDNQLVESKIDVSDDEDDDDEHDEEGESDNEEHLQDNDNIKLLTIDSNNSNFLEQSSDIESDSDSDSNSDNQSISDIEELKEDNIVSSSDISALENLQDISLNKIEKIVVDDDINDDDKDKKVIEINNDDLTENINYSKMKVNELRELAIKKNLVKSTDNTKYKKDELIQLLQK